MNPPSGNRNAYRVIGTMSGTSLDGLDLAACIFTFENQHWNFSIEFAETVSYPAVWELRLANARNLNAEELIMLHTDYGKYAGHEVSHFICKTGFKPDLIASHGHTVFHQPEKGFTFQVGSGAMVAAETGIATVSDFRITDVALGGQGAPLVPAGDLLLFTGYQVCLNLGGFANVSTIKDGKLIAYDICPVNFVLNHFMRQSGKPFDRDGETGRRGKIIQPVLENLNQLEYYALKPPKSLGSEWVDRFFLPLLKNEELSVQDKLRTIYEHISFQIAGCLNTEGEILVTGGGAYNVFLLDLIKEKTHCKLTIPEDRIIQYKEALIFAFLGLLRNLGEVNCFSSVTGARKDSSSGIVFLP